MAPKLPQRNQLTDFLRVKGIARSSEIISTGVTATAISRLVREGALVRLSRGLYQMPDAAAHVHHSLAEASKRVPRGVVCLVSALAFHGLTDRMPRRVWMAIGPKDWHPKVEHPPLRIVRFSEPYLSEAVEDHVIEGVTVRIFGVAKTVADLFRHRKTVGLNVAIEGVREALHQRKATPGEIARAAEAGGVWTVMRPYVEALTGDG